MAAKTKVVHLVVEPAMYRELKEMAKHGQCSLAVIIRQAVASHLKQQSSQKDQAA